MGHVSPENMTESMHSKKDIDMPRFVGKIRLMQANMAIVMTM